MEFEIGELSLAEGPAWIEATKGNEAPMKNSARITELEKEIKVERDKYQRILAKDKKYRGSLCKDMYNITISLNYSKRRLRRVKYMRLQLEALYKRNLALQAQIKGMKQIIGDHEMLEAASRFDVVAQVATEVDEKQVLP